MIAAEDSSLIFCYSSVFCIVGAFQFPFIRLLTRHIAPTGRASMLWSSLERFDLFGLASGTGELPCCVAFPTLLPMLGNLQGPQKTVDLFTAKSTAVATPSIISHFS